MPTPFRRIRPKEFAGFLLNPHKGCATFQRFNGDPLYGPDVSGRWSERGPEEFPPRQFEDVTPGYLPCTVAYCRWFWDLFEPEQGRLDWTVVEKALMTGHERGQTLQVRLMPHGSARQVPVPQWYRDKYKTVMKVTHSGSPLCNVPIYDSDEFLGEWGRVISDFGERFDGQADLESVDVSFIGPWGEGAGECSEEAVDRMMGIYKAAHPVTPLMTMISGYKMTAGVRAGMGWRLDCFGDLGIFKHPNLPKDQWWMHHYDCYPKEVVVCGAQDAWKHAPVTFESCGVPMDWHEGGFDIDFILKQGLKFHGSVFMPKSNPLPETWMEKFRAFCNDLGYRFVVRQVMVDSRVERGGPVHYSVWIENVGVAPIYRRYAFALKFSQNGHTHVHHSDADVRTWLPGDVWLDGVVRLPEGFEPGGVIVSAGLVDRESGVAKVRFANEGVDTGGWLPLEAIEIQGEKETRA